MRQYSDQLGSKFRLKGKPKRIISLVPSITEYLIDLGAQVIGRTKFCIHPQDQVEGIEIVGGTKKFRFDTIEKLNPDLIIGNKEENYREGIEYLKASFPVWMSDVNSIEQSLSMMKMLGDILGLMDQAEILQGKIQNKWEEIRGGASGTMAYLIWRDPWMGAGTNTYIHSVLDHLGYENVILKSRYPEINLKELLMKKPDLLFLSSEPFPFKKKS